MCFRVVGTGARSTRVVVRPRSMLLLCNNRMKRAGGWSRAGIARWRLSGWPWPRVAEVYSREGLPCGGDQMMRPKKQKTGPA